MDPTSPLPSLLSLPYGIRKRIYIFAGLVRECPITITISPHSRATMYFAPRPTNLLCQECAYQHRKNRLPNCPKCVSYGYDPECSCPDVPKQLLLVCKPLHREVQELLYSENKFVVRAYRQAEDLMGFKTIPVDGLRALRYLLVRLNSWPYARGHSVSNPELGNCLICPAGASESYVSSGDPELSTGNSLSESSIKGWMEICQRLSGITPGALHLEFICDAGDLATAKRIIEPMKSLPRLKECVIRLGRKTEYALRSLAESTALELTRGIKKNKPPALSFSSLPKEIRLRILWFTNLGPGGSFLKRSDDILETVHIQDGKFVYDNAQLGLSRGPRTCCLNCSFTKAHCSCPSNYASYSASCSCRLLPLELFYVSWQMYLDAIDIFFSTNILEFQGPFSDTQKMLESLSPRSLRHLRRISFDLNDLYPFSRAKHEPQWRSLLSFINTQCNTSQLCVAIDLSSDILGVMNSEDTDDAIRTIYTEFMVLMRAVKDELSGLLDFHLELGVSWDLEPVLEKYIMGPDYNSENGNRYSKMVPEVEGDDYYRRIPPCHEEL